jgi:hypothetical protein
MLTDASRLKVVLAALFAVMTLAAAPAYADDTVPILAPGTYHLNNHPDGNKSPPPYGLRLDELVNVKWWRTDVFTFDFDHVQSDMRLDLTETTARIYGTVYGGRDTGSGYASDFQGLWEVDFLYQDIFSLVPTDNDYEDNTDNDRGTITQLFDAGGQTAGTAYDLFSYHGFFIGDEMDDSGHRGFAGVSGWGWLAYSGGKPKNGAQDWLFTVGKKVVVPEPSTYLTLGTLLAFAACAQRRRRAVRHCA